MPHELDQILISSSQPDFENRLRKLRFGIVHATRFKIGSKQYEQVRSIVQDVAARKDAAVVEYTQKFDGVKLTPKQFKVSEEDLDKAHTEIQKNLLYSLCQAIENVRKYQTEIFIGSNTHPGIRYTPIRRVGICVPGPRAGAPTFTPPVDSVNPAAPISLSSVNRPPGAARA